MFILKKIVSGFFFPLSVVILILLLGTFLKRSRRKILITGIVLLYLFSFNPFSYLVLRPLESRYEPVSASDLHKDVQWIVVLGGGSHEDKALTAEDRLIDAGLKRLLEGVRLARLLPEARLVLSGGDYRGVAPDALIMRQAALNQGIQKERIIIEKNSWDTVDQAQFLKGRLSGSPFYLVTSASHMPRSMRLFEALGVKPIAAPTDFRAHWGTFHITDLFPSAENLVDTERAFHEYLGIIWTFVRGWI